MLGFERKADKFSTDNPKECLTFSSVVIVSHLTSIVNARLSNVQERHSKVSGRGYALQCFGMMISSDE